MTDWYQEDLAYIHDVGFQNYALQAMPAILDRLSQNRILSGLVVDLGCGSGLSSQLLHQANYQVLGIDISTDMIALARARVPAATFRVESLFCTEIPACAAVLAIGECLNYLFDPNTNQALKPLFQRVYDALQPGGLFIFDGVISGQVPSNEIAKTFSEGEDWIVLVEKREDRTHRLLTRRIISLRQIGDLYRRSEEIHRQRLFEVNTLMADLIQIGFQVQTMDRWGQFSLPPARVAVIAQK